LDKSLHEKACGQLEMGLDSRTWVGNTRALRNVADLGTFGEDWREATVIATEWALCRDPRILCTQVCLISELAGRSKATLN
jgi:hypothetical protein